MKNGNKILFVCTGNTCRSFMAQSIAQHHLKQLKNDTDEIIISSAGVGAYEGGPPSLEATASLIQLGIDVPQHFSRALTAEMIKEADLILVMTEAHKKQVLRLEPEAKDKVFLLKEYVEAKEKEKVPQRHEYPEVRIFDVVDPYGQGIEVYLECAIELEGYILRLIENKK